MLINNDSGYYGWRANNRFILEVSTGKRWNSMTEIRQEYGWGVVRKLWKRGEILICYGAGTRNGDNELAPYLKYNCEKNLNNE